MLNPWAGLLEGGGCGEDGFLVVLAADYLEADGQSRRVRSPRGRTRRGGRWRCRAS